MDGLIDMNATFEQIDAWFSSTLQEDRVPRLALTIQKWEHEDLSKLMLDERLSQEEIVELLKEEQSGSRPIIHHLLDFNQASALIPLLDRVTPKHLLSLVRLKYEELNVVSRASMQNTRYLYFYIVKHLGIDELYNLLFEHDEKGRTALHWTVRKNYSIGEVLSLLKDKIRSNLLLSIRDTEGQSVLSHSIFMGSEESFQSIIRYYAGEQAELLELAILTDNIGNTSFHYAAGQGISSFLIDLIKATCSLETRGKLTSVLSMHNDSGRKKVLGFEVDEFLPENELIYDWAFDSLSKDQYLTFDFPSILIMYNTVRRYDADEEATSLEKCFTYFGFKVKAKSSFTKKELFEAIKEHQGKAASRNGQIVALMSHGSEGYIEDNDERPISLYDIERRMCADSHRDTPKLLIIQACQSRKSSDAYSDGPGMSPSRSADIMSGCHDSRGEGVEVDIHSGFTSQVSRAVDMAGAYRHELSYCCRSPDFCAIMSCGPGVMSERNTFIPFLARAITDARIDASISQIMGSVKRNFPVTVPEQAPICLDALKFDFCINKILAVQLCGSVKGKSKAVKRTQQERAPGSLKHQRVESERSRKEHLEQDAWGLHWVVQNNSFILSLPNDEIKAHNLLSSTDKKGRSVLLFSIYRGSEESFQTILRHYTNRQLKLLELAAIPDNDGNTSFHYAVGQRTSNFIIHLIKSICSPDTRDELAKVLSRRNVSGGMNRLGYEVDEFHSENELIYDWAIKSIHNKRYMLFEKPSVLVFYTTANRSYAGIVKDTTVNPPDAETEAQTLIKSLESLDLIVKPFKDFTEMQMTDEIYNSQNSRDKNGQIVAIMSHGTLGAIKDNNGEEIPFKDIEQLMRGGDMPKVLIAQCCQSFKREEPTDVEMTTQSVETQTFGPVYAWTYLEHVAIATSSRPMALHIPVSQFSMEQATVIPAVTIEAATIRQEEELKEHHVNIQLSSPEVSQFLMEPDSVIQMETIRAAIAQQEEERNERPMNLQLSSPEVSQLLMEPASAIQGETIQAATVLLEEELNEQPSNLQLSSPEAWQAQIEPASVIQGEMFENTVLQQEKESDEENPLLVDPEEDCGVNSKYNTFYPDTYHFGALMSCAPNKTSRRNRFIPALSKSLEVLQLNQNIATLMNPVKTSVRKDSKGKQAASFVDLLEYDFCIKNILPLYLASKRK